MARREIPEAEQQRLDRYKQRRDEYVRELAGLAPPLPEDQAAELVVPARGAGPPLPRRRRTTRAHRGPGIGR